MEYENALNFLMFSYFGIDGGVKAIKNPENKNEIIKLCAQRAYLDLARTVKFKYSSSQLDKWKAKKAQDKDREKATSYQKAKNGLINEICEEILDSTENAQCTNDFSNWHKEKCEAIKKIMNERQYKEDEYIISEKSFTIGQVQKWLNMTLKYLWLLDMLPDGLTEDLLHVPIDSFILQELKVKVNGVTGSGETYYYKRTTWSAMDNYDDYMNLQSEIIKIAREEGKSPIAWEGSAWIEVAKTRNSKNGSSEGDI